MAFTLFFHLPLGAKSLEWIQRFNVPPDAAQALNLADGIGEMRLLAPQCGGAQSALVRYNGARLELFLDGVLIDEDWPIGTPQEGTLRDENNVAISAWRREERALSDDEIESLNDGAETIARRADELLGKETLSRQYWKPRGHNAWAGDAMLTWHDGRLHLLHLFDRRHHGSKWGAGAHQFAHHSTSDLKHWKSHLLAYPITRQSEASHGTGCMVVKDGVFHLFAQNLNARLGRENARINPPGVYLCTSEDGERFQEIGRVDGLPDGQVEPGIWRDENGLFHMAGLSFRATSRDLFHWEIADEKFLPPMGWPVSQTVSSCECCCWFEWNGWHYILRGRTGFWMARHHEGPFWEGGLATNKVAKPRWDVYDGLMVPQAAPFGENRRILCGWIDGGDWASVLVFRELIQHEDGTLGLTWPPETIPATAAPLEGISPSVSMENSSHSVPVPHSAWLLRAEVSPQGAAQFGISFGPHDNKSERCELRFEPQTRRVQWGTAQGEEAAPESNGVPSDGRDFAIHQVENIAAPFTLEVVAKPLPDGSVVLDACIARSRTLITRRKDLSIESLRFFARGGACQVQNIEVRFLKEHQ
jgi:beta-fructofuranosidase